MVNLTIVFIPLNLGRLRISARSSYGLRFLIGHAHHLSECQGLGAGAEEEVLWHRAVSVSNDTNMQPYDRACQPQKIRIRCLKIGSVSNGAGSV